MRKLFLGSSGVILALIAAYFVSAKPNESMADAYQRVLPIKKKLLTSTVKKVKSYTNKSTSGAVKNVTKLTDCIDSGKCLKKREGFFDEKLDPQFTQLRRQLETLSMIEGADKSISRNQLEKIIKFKQQSTFALAVELLLKKDPRNIQVLSELDFSGEEIKLLRHIISDRGQSELRRKIVSKTIEQDNYSFLSTLKNLNYYQLENEEVREYKNRACRRLDKIDQFKATYQAQIDKIARKYQLPTGC